jgi:hypothetical protein
MAANTKRKRRPRRDCELSASDVAYLTDHYRQANAKLAGCNRTIEDCIRQVQDIDRAVRGVNSGLDYVSSDLRRTVDGICDDMRRW